MAKDIVSGAGARHSVVMELNEDGLPLPDAASAEPYVGVEVEGIKTFSPTEGTPVQHTHFGEDVVIARQTFPTRDADTLAFTTAKSNVILDAVLAQSKIREYAHTRMQVSGGNTRGDEAFVLAMSVQQAVDTDKSSATFARLTQWRGFLVPTVQIRDQPLGMAENVVDKAYAGDIQPFFFLPWGEEIDEENWGKEMGTYINLHADYRPFPASWRSDGVTLMYLLHKSPKDDEHLLVWSYAGGVSTLLTPDTIVTGATPSFTLDVADTVPEDGLIFALIQTDRPGQIVTFGSPPAAPTLDTPADEAEVNDDTPTLAWIAVTGATRYRIQIAPDNPFLDPVVDEFVEAPTVQFTPTAALDEDAQYWWRVRAVSASGEGAWSTARSFTVNVTP